MAAEHFEILEERFKSCVRITSKPIQLFDGCIWAEGPVYFPAHRALLFSDIPNDRLLKYDETTEQVSVFRTPSHNANGNTVDRHGRLISCEQSTRRVTRTEHDGSVSILMDKFKNKRFNSPNDIVVKSDGSIWFTDPSYGIDSFYEGNRAESEIGGDYVYCLEPETGAVKTVATDFVRPNGLAFSPNESKLYIVDSGGSRSPDNRRHIRVFDVNKDNTLSGGSVFAESTSGAFDGLRSDEFGNIWTSAGDGVHCYDIEGVLLGKIKIPEQVSNLCFGGPKRNRLYITATTSLYTILLPNRGIAIF